MREKWNDNWRVWKEDNAFRLIFSVPEDAHTIDLPHDAAFHRPQSIDSVNQGRTGFLDGGVFNYYKEYYADPKEQGQTIRLLFDGVMGRASVYVNGSLAGENDYAYSEFYVDIGAWLKYGKVNQILVMANAMDLSSRYYCGAGICRDVYLIKQGDVRIEPESLRCTTLEVENSEAVVRIEADIVNDRACMVDDTLEIIVVGRAGEVCREAVKVNLPAKAYYHLSQRLALENIIQWDEYTPELYEISIDVGGMDSDSITTGFRTLSLDDRRGLRVNGRPVRLRGACIHHDQGLLGAATYDGWERYRVQRLKEAGFNAVRCAHNPASRALLRACDALGVYVMDEAFDMWARMKNPQDYALFFTKPKRKTEKTEPGRLVSIWNSFNDRRRK